MSRDPIIGIDHALIGVRDLESARETWTRFGFTVTPRGRHIGWGTANYCIMLRRDYIELLGIVDPGQFTNDLDRFLERGEGALGLAFATDDALAAAAELTARGITVDGPKDLKRILELPQGDVLPAFSLVHLTPEATPGLKAFLCQHLSRDLVWQPQWTAHPNTALGLRRATIAVEDPEATARAYAEIWGRDVDVFLAKPEAADLLFAGVPLQFLRPDVLDFEVPADPPFIAHLGIEVGDVAAVRACLSEAGIPFEDEGNSVLLGPETGNGIELSFDEG
ncbi:MAG: VOC family protein [Kiloniellales bacterium]|nr:VOC family protein [Kiloniellales bacterium]